MELISQDNTIIPEDTESEMSKTTSRRKEKLPDLDDGDDE